MSDTAQTYDIELLGFPSVDNAAAVVALATTFRIDEDKARRLIDKAPVKVRAKADSTDAMRYTRALVAIGADVRVSGAGGDQTFRATDAVSVSGAWPAAAGATSPRPKPATEGTGTQPEKSASSSPPPSANEEASTSGAAVLRRTRSREVAAVSPTLLSRCPKCGFEQPESDSCARCGIIFSKYGSSGPPSSQGRKRRPTPSGSAAYRAPRESLYTLSTDDDDGLFQSKRPAVDPGRILLEAATLVASPNLVGRAVGSIDESRVIRGPTGRAAEETQGSSDVGFWDKLGRAFAFGVSGKAYQWLLLLAVLGGLSYGVIVVVTKVPTFFVQIFGLFVLIVLFSAFLAVQWRFFDEAFRTAIADRDDDMSPVYGLEDFKSELVLPGQVLLIGAVILWGPFFYVAFKAFDSGIPPSAGAVVLTSLLPLIYWPMGMAWVSASGRLSEIFIVTGIVKGMVIGGLEYVFTAALGVLVFFGVDQLAAVVGENSFLIMPALYTLLGYTSAVQGYLLGRLLRRRPNMIEGVEVEETG